ncbi:transglutaminase domain-containing protein, partial [Faecalibacillus intestinalis]|uniref:transglutaminase domain-containing protein n=1 Tax=Faecalibacillus intestinalis TaxID=1982626 RepID=UPI003992355F
MKKKLFIVSLVLSMCFSMLSIVNVQAKETIREDHYVNPIYKDVKSSVVHHDIQTYSLEDVEYTSDQEKLVKIFREKLINRESNIVLYYHCDEEITQEFFSNLVHQLFQKAIKHTGNGKEGDYLKWHCQGWTVKASISVNSNKGYDLNIFYDVSYLSSLEQEEKVDEEVSNLLKSLDLSNKTDYQKVKAIYDYICSNVTYDHDNLNDKSYSLKYTAYAALINKTAVCQGYASLFYRLALDAGVDTRVISGEAGGPHAWNIVKLNGKYYNLDSTWDAGRSTYAYFLKNTNDFDDHVRDNDYQSNEFIEEYPMWDESYTEIDCNKYGHNYSEPIYKWSVDNMTVTAQRVCANNYEHVEEETVTAQKIVKDPTCTENGIITYIANFKNNAFKPQTKIVDDKKATGHKVVVDQGKKATCTEDGLTEGKHCSVCKEVIKKQEVIPATGHKVVVDQGKKATCTE